MFGFAAVVVCGTAAGPGVTWDEPTHRTSQNGIRQWFLEIGGGDASMLRKASIDQYWDCNRFGANFHPPMAGYLNLASFAAFGSFLDDMVARRWSSSLEFAFACALLCGFVGGRYGTAPGWFAGLSALLTPRMMGDAHAIGTDMPLLFFWAVSAFAFWRGLESRGWQWTFAFAMACLFLVKFTGVMILAPLVVWLLGAMIRTPQAFGRWARWSVIILAPTIVLGGFVLLSGNAAVGKRPPNAVEQFLFSQPWAVWVLLISPGVALVAFRLRQRNSTAPWNVAFETPWAVAALTPILVVVLNPTWWHDTLRGLSSYLHLQLHRVGTHPDIAIYFLGNKYTNFLPWPNAFILMAVTIPFGLLFLGAVGCGLAIRRPRVHPLALYFFLHAMTLPVVRMFPTPAHDGVRLFLPTFLFWAGLAGIAGATIARGRRVVWAILFAIGPGWAAVDWVRSHPYELSYYNVGLPRAIRLGFETTYWYDAVTPEVLADLNDGPHRLPDGIPIIAHLDRLVNTETFLHLQQVGKLRQDLVLDPRPITCKTWAFLLSHSSKSTAIKRLLYACEPWYESRHQGVRMFSVVEPRALNMASALAGMAIERNHTSEFLPARLFEPAFQASREDYMTALAAYRGGPVPDPESLAGVLLRHWSSHPVAASLLPQIQREDPGAIDRAVDILVTRPADVRKVVTKLGYLPAAEFGGYFPIH